MLELLILVSENQRLFNNLDIAADGTYALIPRIKRPTTGDPQNLICLVPKVFHLSMGSFLFCLMSDWYEKCLSLHTALLQEEN